MDRQVGCRGRVAPGRPPGPTPRGRGPAGACRVGCMGTALARTQRRARRTGHLRTRTLKNRLTPAPVLPGAERMLALGAAVLACAAGGNRFDRSLVHRSRSGLGLRSSAAGGRSCGSYRHVHLRSDRAGSPPQAPPRRWPQRSHWRQQPEAQPNVVGGGDAGGGRGDLGGGLGCRWTRGQNRLCHGRNRPRRGNRWWGSQELPEAWWAQPLPAGGSVRRSHCGRRAGHCSRRLKGRGNRFFLLRNCLKNISRPGKCWKGQSWS